MKLNLVSCALLITLMIHYSSQYIELSIEDDDLCPPTNRKRRIKLDTEFRSGLIVKQFRLNDHDIDWNINKKCRFQVVPTGGNEGIIAVIQHLVFRKNFTTDECIDYVQFTRKDGSSSQKYCGRFNAAIHMDHNFINPAEVISSGTAFVEEKGELDVIIFVAKEYLRSDEEMDLSIVFTSYKPCSNVFKKDTTYRPCNNERKKYCIFSGFFRDTYINCPFPDCEDEEGCLKTTDVVGYFNGSKVLIGAVSSVFVVFVVFILCLWICKTYKIFCWAHSFANPSSTSTPQNQQNESSPRVIELSEQTQPRASAPAANSASANQLDEDKDLPPSYESLFPSR